MLVWSNIFNIAFVSALGALIVFFLVSTIVVAAKGKRKCNAFDVILRIISTLVFIASAAMLAAAVLMLISGSFCIAIVADAPILVIGDNLTELPLPELFVALSSSLGLMLAALLFICSLAALIVDCLVANKKIKKVKKQPVQKTPEQLKREAELERIRKIGEDAVKRAGHAAKYAESTPEKKSAPKAQAQAQSNAQAQAKAQTQAQASTTQAAAAEAPKQPTPENEPVSDWRAQTEPERPTEFVGLSNTNDPDFDTFDSFDDDVSEQKAEETDDIIITERDLEPEQDKIEDDFDVQEQVEDEPASEQDDFEQAEDYSQDEFVEDEPVRDEFEQADDEQEYTDEYTDEVADEDESSAQPEETDDFAGEQSEYADGADDFGEPEAEDEIEQIEDEYAVDEEVEQPESELEQEQYEELEQEPTREEKQEKPLEDEYEPDRDIYIPRIRTIVRNNGNAPVEKPNKTTKSTGKSTSRKKPTETKAAPASKSAVKPVAKKSAAKNTSTAKKSAPKKSAAPSATSVKAKNTTPTIPPEKKLPITRRYVILDRRNAVNMFGEYLKDRNQAEKDKLKSSINTIIIE